jgi:hypothetical protein
MNNFMSNTFTNHPVMPVPHDTAEYQEVKYYVSVHSEDRNILKYPNSSTFEIELPRDFYNVKTLNVSELALPINIDTFNELFNNVFMVFRFIDIYNPLANIPPGGSIDPLQQLIYYGLVANLKNEYRFKIESGFYSVGQLATELTNKFNWAVTQYLKQYILDNQPSLLDSFTGYNEFVIVYNYVSQYLWFGNRSSSFEITNNSTFYTEQEEYFNSLCVNAKRFTEYTNWGLPNNLGFILKKNEFSKQAEDNGEDVRFFYGDVVAGDNGYWLTPNPDLNGAHAYYVRAPLKINILGESYIYLLINGWNNIDMTYPFNDTVYTQRSNITNGAVEYAFGKIPVGSTPIALSYCSGFFNPKVFEPPLNSIRKLNIEFRYHNGLIVDFQNMPLALTFEITCLDLKRKTK